MSGAIDETAYERIRKEADRTEKRLTTEIRNNNEDLYEAQDRQKKAGKESQNRSRTGTNTLLQSRNNIPSHLVNLRKEICAALKIENEELPFAGELMQIRTQDLDWQPALEKLLNTLVTAFIDPRQIL